MSEKFGAGEGDPEKLAIGEQRPGRGVVADGGLAICTVDGDIISKVASIDNVEAAGALVEHLRLMLNKAISGRDLSASGSAY